MQTFEDHKSDLAFLETTLLAAGRVTLAKFGRMQQYQQKQEAAQIVTEVDVATEKLIVELLQARYPTHSILAEESGFIDKKSEYTWVIDPVDGTSNYAVGIPWYGVIIARLKNWKADLGGVYLPVTNELFLASKGSGAFKNGKKFVVSYINELSTQLINYSLDGYKDLSNLDSELRIIKNLAPKVRNIRSTNSVVDFMYASDGRFGAALNQGTRIWDIAAPLLIAQEAGCMVADISGNEINLDINGNLSKNFSIIIANPGLYQSILQIIKQASIEK